MDIYAGIRVGGVQVGDSATIGLWANEVPGSYANFPGHLITTFTESVAEVDTVGADAGENRIHVDFTFPLLVNANTPYWIGMTGTSTDFLQTLVTGSNPLNELPMAQSNGGYGDFIYSNGYQMPFRLYGYAISTPEPSGFALLCMATIMFAGYCGWRRRKLVAA